MCGRKNNEKIEENIIMKSPQEEARNPTNHKTTKKEEDLDLF